MMIFQQFIATLPIHFISEVMQCGISSAMSNSPCKKCLFIAHHLAARLHADKKLLSAVTKAINLEARERGMQNNVHLPFKNAQNFTRRVHRLVEVGLQHPPDRLPRKLRYMKFQTHKEWMDFMSEVSSPLDHIEDEIQSVLTRIARILPDTSV